MRDTQAVARNVIGGTPAGEAQLVTNREAFALLWVGRAEFVLLYPETQTPEQYVNALYAQSGLTNSESARTAAIAEFGGASNTTDRAARARALRRIADAMELRQQEFREAFVLAEYFGYLRRNVDEMPDNSFGGYDFWLEKLNMFADFRSAEMVESFLLSPEYRQRFAQP